MLAEAARAPLNRAVPARISDIYKTLAIQEGLLVGLLLRAHFPLRSPSYLPVGLRSADKYSRQDQPFCLIIEGTPGSEPSPDQEMVARAAQVRP